MSPDLIAEFEQALRQWPVLVNEGLLADLKVETVTWPLFAEHDVQVDILRADQLHPQISGNKWFKLKYNLVAAQRQGCNRLLSFGGPWSNHLHALAYVSRLLGMSSHGIVPGDELDAQANPMLREAAEWGMELEFVSRRQYRAWTQEGYGATDAQTWLIPEGGDNEQGLLGCMSLVSPALWASHEQQWDQIWLALGTGCTLAGVRLALPPSVRVRGVAVLAGDWPKQHMQKRLQQQGWHNTDNWDLLLNYHAGGYARVPPELLSFIADFGDNTGVPLDPVYTGKAMQALCDQVRQGRVPAGTRVLFIHTGGLQGARGFSSSTGCVSSKG